VKTDKNASYYFYQRLLTIIIKLMQFLLMCKNPSKCINNVRRFGKIVEYLKNLHGEDEIIYYYFYVL